ncbi:MAG: sigma-70 family RNA polymerase sigma factor, partial [Victivallales bacterium]|nr:sigma-70 family RNA polymerase sigma factor [Victivallales bacterium]
RQTLIRRLKNTADDAAWKEFYDFYRQLIQGWARGFGCSPEKADDVFQETMVSLLRNIPAFQYKPDKGSFRSYLKTIVRSRCYDLFRKESRYLAVGDDAGRDAGTPEDANIEDDVVWLDSLVRQALRRVYGKVDQLTYKSFCMYVLEACPVAEVSRKLGDLRIGTVYQQKSRMLKMLEKEFLLLLAEMGESPLNSRSRGIFVKAFEEMLSRRPEYRETMLTPETSSNAAGKVLELVSPALNKLPEDGSGFYLCMVENGRADHYKWYELNKSVSVGSKPECDLVLHNDPQVSGVHLEINRRKDCFRVRDCNSANGSYLNCRKLTGETVLNDGDIITLGADSVLVFNQL